MKPEIQITEEFDSNVGQLVNYDLVNGVEQANFDNRRHLTLRTLNGSAFQYQTVQSTLDNLSQEDLAGITQGDLERLKTLVRILADRVDISAFLTSRGYTGSAFQGFLSSLQVAKGSVSMLLLDDEPISNLESEDMRGLEERPLTATESWTQGAAVKTSSLGNRYALTWDLSTGTNVNVSQDIPLDLSGFTTTDFVSLALPSFPATSLTLSQSYLTISDGTASQVFTFSDSVTALTDGNCEARWPNTLGTMKPTTITLTMKATASATLVVAAIRLLSPQWTPTKLGINTRTENLEPIVTRTGTVPTAAFPTVWRANQNATDVGRASDPRPVNIKLSTVFNTGSLSQTGSVKFFFRGGREDTLTQLDINGGDLNNDGILDVGYDQGALDALGKQPGYTGQALFKPQPQSDLDTLTQTQIDGSTQASLERLQDTVAVTWVEATLSWTSTTTTILVKNSTTYSGDEYTFTVPGHFDANTNYLFRAGIDENTFRCRVFTLNEYEGVNTTLFDSGTIVDDVMFRRRQGRVGWTFTLGDGDSYIRNVRANNPVFGEYRSHHLLSHTPVVGGRLVVSATPDRELYQGAKAWRSGSLGIDHSISNSDDGSLQATGSRLFGIQTLPINIENFSQTKITFDAYVPENFQLNVALANQYGYFIPLVLPALVPEKWNGVQIKPKVASLEQSGRYFLMFFGSGNTTTSFWIDNLSINQRMISWSARAVQSDPWNRFDPDWTEFEDLINTDNGVMFRDRGTQAQIRGQALSPNVMINRVYLKPKYAELGRFVWEVPGRRYYNADGSVDYAE